ncbi:MAG: hypothetical protein IPM47_02305 [Sphingobacteriales bacterium]|nr:MAG: hypothetical protein IPM47_02305 [Sphingobacteriales bacterium]
MKNFLSTILVLCFSFIFLKAQDIQPVSWEVSSQELGDNEFLLSFDAKVDKGWFIYSQHIKSTPPLPTTISFQQNSDFELQGRIEEFGKAINDFDPIFEKEIRKYASSVSFQARVKTHKKQTKIVGTLEFMACDKSRCLPPSRQEFSFNLVVSDFENMLAKEVAADKYEIVKSKKFSSEEYIPSSMEISVGRTGPLALNDSDNNQRATASRTKAPVSLPKEEVYNEDKTVDLEMMAGDLLVAANFTKFIKSKSGKKAEASSKKDNNLNKKQIAQLQPKPAEIKRAAPQPFINPINWSFSLRPVENSIYEMTFTASIQDNWYLYAQNNTGSAPFPMEFMFDENNDIQFIEDAAREEGVLLTEFDPVFEKTVNRYAGTVTFKRMVQFLKNVKVTGSVKYMAANNEQYLMPKEVRFSLNNSLMIPVPSTKSEAVALPSPLQNNAASANFAYSLISVLMALGLLIFIKKVKV